MRRKIKHNRRTVKLTEGCFNFRCVAVGSYAVGFKGIVELGIMGIEFSTSTRAGGTGFSINDDGISLNQMIFTKGANARMEAVV